MDFWIDQYGEEFDRVIDAVLEISKGNYTDEVTNRFKALKPERGTISALLIRFSEIVMIGDIVALKRADGSDLASKTRSFLEQLQHSNFTEDDANILAAVVLHLLSSSKRSHEVEQLPSYEGVQFRFNLVHPKILKVARNLHPGIEEIYQSLQP